MVTFGLEVNWSGSTWTDESGYLLSARASCGFRFGSLVADAGRAVFSLDNKTRRFSPGNSSSLLYGLLLPRRPIRLKAGSVVIWRGFIERIETAAGGWGEKSCTLVCVDGLALLDQQRVGVAHEDTKAVDDAVSALVAATFTPPGTSYADNGDELTHYGRTWQPEKTTAVDALRDVCASVYGRFWMARDGTATYWSRSELQDASTGAALTLAGAEPVTGLEIGLGIDQVVNQVQVTVYPVETIGAVQTLWESQSVLRLGPGETRTVYGLFRDSYGERCGAVDVVTPVATTDYTVNDKRDGTGFDYTVSLSFGISTTVEATRIAFELSNSASGPLYVTSLKVRGKPIVTYDPVTVQYDDATSQAAYQVRAQVVDLPMQEDDNLAQSYAEYLVGRNAQPSLAAKLLTVRNQETVAGVNVFSLDLMDKVVLTEGESGLSAAGHWITGLEYEIGPKSWLMAAHLERADDTRYWMLGVTSWGELDSATRLGF